MITDWSQAQERSVDAWFGKSTIKDYTTGLAALLMEGVGPQPRRKDTDCESPTGSRSLSAGPPSCCRAGTRLENPENSPADNPRS